MPTNHETSIKEEFRRLILQGCTYSEILTKLKNTYPQVTDDASLMVLLKKDTLTPDVEKRNTKYDKYEPYITTIQVLIRQGETIPNIATHLNENARFVNGLCEHFNIPTLPPKEIPQLEPLTKDQWEAVVSLTLDGYTIAQIHEELELSYDEIIQFCLEYYVPYTIMEGEKIERQFNKKENDIYALYLAGYTQAAIGEKHKFAQSYISRILKLAIAMEQTKGLKAFYSLDDNDYYDLFEKYLEQDKLEWNDAVIQIAALYKLPNKWVFKILALKGICKSGYIKNKKFAKDVFEKCIAQGMSQVDMAEHLGIDQGTVSRYCRKYDLTTQHAYTKVIGSPLEDEVVRLLNQNQSCYQIAKNLDCAYATILKIGKAHNLAYARNAAICQTEVEDHIVEALKKGIPKGMVAEIYNCSYNTVYKIAKRHNITRSYKTQKDV